MPGTRYVAFLRGVSPMNARMPELKACFESAGFSGVRTLLSSGNVVFDARPSSLAALERRCERAMESGLGRSFATFVRSTAHLQGLLQPDRFAAYELPASAKAVITFLRRPVALSLELPLRHHGASILQVTPTEVLSAYVPGPQGPVFMSLLERTFGKDITTRTRDTVRKCAWA